jgi:hypothetical protein
VYAIGGSAGRSATGATGEEMIALEGSNPDVLGRVDLNDKQDK